MHSLKKLREVVCLVLELREEKWTFAKVEGEKIDFFLYTNKRCTESVWAEAFKTNGADFAMSCGLSRRLLGLLTSRLGQSHLFGLIKRQSMFRKFARQKSLLIIIKHI
jgi:hypothetical protein